MNRQPSRRAFAAAPAVVSLVSLVSLVSAFAISLPLVLAPAAAHAAHITRFVPGQLIVGFKDASVSARRAVHLALGAKSIQPLVHPGMDLVTFEDGADLNALQGAYLARPDVEFAELNGIGEGGGQVIPNDTWYHSQWQLNNTGQSGGTPGADIDAQEGWAYSEGSATITVAVLDTGIDSDHPEFAGRILPGWDYVNNDGNPEDDQGHGTEVSGLLAANADNGFAVAGVDHRCMILPVKILDSSNMGTTANLINGVGFASAQHVDVISMSLINYPCSTGLDTALRDAKLAGAVLVACAGNGGIGDADISCPGASPHTISIGATRDNDWRASYSGTGNSLEFVAPGDLVVTVAYNSGADISSLFAGCSAATPTAAGIVSILRGLGASAGVVLKTQHIRQILQMSAEDLVGNPAEDTPGRDNYMGWGRLNLRRAVETFFSETAAPVIAASGGLQLEASPNPMKNTVSLRFSLPAATWVKVSLLDVAGRSVRSLSNGLRPAGPQEIHWDGTQADGRPVAAGVYFVRVKAADTSVIRRITLVR